MGLKVGAVDVSNFRKYTELKTDKGRFIVTPNNVTIDVYAAFDVTDEPGGDLYYRRCPSRSGISCSSVTSLMRSSTSRAMNHFHQLELARASRSCRTVEPRLERAVEAEEGVPTFAGNGPGPSWPEIPTGYIPIRSATYNGYALFRAIPASSSDEDVAKAIALVKQLKLYPLAMGSNPKPEW